MRIALIVLLLATMNLAADVIPPERLITWRKGVTVGVPGGIPYRTNIFTNMTLLDTNGLLDCAPAIANAIAICPSNYVIKLPTGTLLCSNYFSFNQRDGITLRGSGPTNTILVGKNPTAAGLINLIVDSIGSAVNLYTNAYKGQSNLVVNSGAGVSVGLMIRVLQTADTNYTWRFLGPAALQSQLVSVRSISQGTNFTIWPPLYNDYTNSPRYYVFNFDSRFCGIEDMRITFDSSSALTYGVQMYQTYACWVKNVEFVGCKSAGVFQFRSLFNEIRDCLFRDPAVSASDEEGIQTYSEWCGGLIENNYFTNLFPALMMSTASSGNAIAYNYITHNDAGVGTQVEGINANHGGHNVFNLFEGNVDTQLKSDGYHGSSGFGMVYRNWLNCSNSAFSTDKEALELNHFSWNWSAIGNVLGHVGIGGTYENETNSYPISLPTIYRLGFPNTGNNQYLGGVGIEPGWNYTMTSTSAVTFNYGVRSFTVDPASVAESLTNGIRLLALPVGTGFYMACVVSNTVAPTNIINCNCNGTLLSGAGVGSTIYSNYTIWVWPQMLDPTVKSTLLRKGNYNFVDSAIPASESIGATNLAASLLYTNEAGIHPSWFTNWGSATFPPIEATNQPTSIILPAQLMRAAWGSPQEGTPGPTIFLAGTLNVFTALVGAYSAEQSYTVSGSALVGYIDITAPSDFQVSTSSGSGFGSSLNLTPTDGSVASTTIYVRFNRATAGTTGPVNITHTSTSAESQNMAVTGAASELEQSRVSGRATLSGGATLR